MPNEGKGKDCSALSHCLAVACRLISSNTEPLQHAGPVPQSAGQAEEEYVRETDDAWENT